MNYLTRGRGWGIRVVVEVADVVKVTALVVVEIVPVGSSPVSGSKENAYGHWVTPCTEGASMISRPTVEEQQTLKAELKSL